MRRNNTTQSKVDALFGIISVMIAALLGGIVGQLFMSRVLETESATPLGIWVTIVSICTPIFLTYFLFLRDNNSSQSKAKAFFGFLSIMNSMLFGSLVGYLFMHRILGIESSTPLGLGITIASNNTAIFTNYFLFLRDENSAGRKVEAFLDFFSAMNTILLGGVIGYLFRSRVLEIGAITPLGVGISIAPACVLPLLHYHIFLSDSSVRPRGSGQ